MKLVKYIKLDIVLMVFHYFSLTYDFIVQLNNTQNHQKYMKK